MDARRDCTSANQPVDRQRGLGEDTNQCDISVVIPVYRSETTLEHLLERLLPVLDRLGRKYEVVLVDDGSPDRSWTIVESLFHRYSDRVVAIQLMRNFGQHNALLCGFRRSRGKFVVTIDDDLQNPPEEIPRMLEEIERSDCDLVYGNSHKKEHASYRNLGSLVVNRFYRAVFRAQVTVTSFRIIRRSLLDAIGDCHSSFVFVDGLMAWNTQRIGSAIVEHHPRQQGASTYSLSKLVTLAINLFTGFSLMPLQISSAAGIVTVLLGLALGAFNFCQLIIGRELGGSFIWLNCLVLVLAGIQLLTLGVMGEYLGRLHMNINGKPQYRERQILDWATSKEIGSSLS